MKNNTVGHLNYLVIGHVTRDIHEGGSTLGGTAAYSAVCARALGRMPAILTAGEKSHPIQVLNGLLL